jgi:hypothetical protein
MLILSSLLVKVPIGILYLGEPNKPFSYGVVVISGVVFTTVLLVFEKRMNHLLLGIAAYYAVLVAFLSNAQ